MTFCNIFLFDKGWPEELNKLLWGIHGQNVEKIPKVKHSKDMEYRLSS